MVRKASIVNKINNFSYNVRLTINNSVDNQIYEATICSIINSLPSFKSGDTVFVSFEDSDIDKPVIVGALATSTTTASTSLKFNSLTVTDTATFLNKITIGNVTEKEFKNIKYTTKNIKEQLNDTNTKLTNITSDTQAIENDIITINNLLDNQDDDLTKINTILNNINNKIGTVEDFSNATVQGRLNLLNNNLIDIQERLGKVPKNITIFGLIEELKSRLTILKDSPAPSINININTNPLSEESTEDSLDEYTPAQHAELLEILAALKSKFPHGRYWNHAPTKGTGMTYNNQDGTTAVPCPVHHNCGTSEQTCNGYAPAGWETSWQCMGYANKCGYDVTGYDPETSNKWVKKTSLAGVKAGDIIRLKNDGHSIFVTGVSGDTLTYTDCNSDGHCKIEWNKTIKKNSINGFTYLRSSPTDLSNSRLLAR